MNIEKLICGIKKDLERGYYKEGDIICFDLVIVYGKFGFRKFVIDNRYKLSKPILDLDRGKEAVVIPLNIKPVTLKSKTLEKDIYYSFVSCREDYSRIYLQNIKLIKRLVKVVKSRYDNQKYSFCKKGIVE